ncbi:bifunctional diaminohydroxyphosphoribosylaminopyrimidine deaminase/5-amino-6-(5-phosphoribosylamino)uracil reductase RibD [Granulicella arctica]|uniref:bifunctional diaminohydroxyphosphoribosylaminopyrimidine deaminase/5-amino-6-(5-phosphoribosylamino)uracil reductase RibD n=1 Tax=Granulicella arctica TaxID=940613 RepID=UPI0021E0B233|nr:bifunctional diaminohydroxyphosphoribosylaminopyrimidine deaminase/5-amino-6-(5-phosphoribosylamino)uracil reductase RibD [Granulicella arctica]
MSDDRQFMQQALNLAAATAALASPNPQVGCVLVRGEKVIGEGAHLFEQRDHAEIAALKHAAAKGHTVGGATAYVTLEPCSHHGRTGPCADALIAAGIARVVVGTQDPNPLVSGQGIVKLRDAGIQVTIGVHEQHARNLIEAFAHFIQHGTPFVTLKAALSVDGKLAPPPAARTGTQPFWLTGPAARAEVQQLRHSTDAILTGIGTVLADDPALTDRTGLPRRRPLLRIVLDTHLQTPIHSQLVRTAKEDLLILCGTGVPTQRITSLELAGAQVEVLPEHNRQISLPAVLKLLGQRKLLSLLLECGSRLNGAFLTQNLVDKAVLFYAETELGDHAIPFAQGIASPFLFEQSLTRVNRTSFGPDACVTGYLHDPWISTPSIEIR